MNAITKQELEKARPDPAGFAEMPPAKQQPKRDLNEPGLAQLASAIEADQLSIVLEKELARTGI